MAKRFTDSNKYSRPWYRDLPLQQRAFWDYLLHSCDHAGIWVEDYDLASFLLGFPVTSAFLEGPLSRKLCRIDEDKIFIRSFVDFQYGELRDNNSIHISIIGKLAQYGVEMPVAEGYSNSPKAILSRLSAKRKKELMADDCFRCTYCGIPGDETTLNIDHIIGRHLGGENQESNLTTACISCNSKKSTIEVFEFIKRHTLEEKLSPRLKSKLDLLKASLNTLIKPLNRVQEEEEEEDKSKDMDVVGSRIKTSAASEDFKPYEPKSKFSLERADIDLCADVWRGTLQHFKMDRTLLESEVLQIAQAIQRKKSHKAVAFALEGARFEPKDDRYNPADFLSLSRILDAEKFDRFMNLGVAEEHRRRKKGA